MTSSIMSFFGGLHAKRKAFVDRQFLEFTLKEMAEKGNMREGKRETHANSLWYDRPLAG